MKTLYHTQCHKIIADIMFFMPFLWQKSYQNKLFHEKVTIKLIDEIIKRFKSIIIFLLSTNKK
jgi:hypothetical protein